MSPLRHPAEVQIFTHALIQRSVEVRRMREASFAVGCLTRRLDLPAFCIEFPGSSSVLRDQDAVDARDADSQHCSDIDIDWLEESHL